MPSPSSRLPCTLVTQHTQVYPHPSSLALILSTRVVDSSTRCPRWHSSRNVDHSFSTSSSMQCAFATTSTTHTSNTYKLWPSAPSSSSRTVLDKFQSNTLYSSGNQAAVRLALFLLFSSFMVSIYVILSENDEATLPQRGSFVDTWRDGEREKRGYTPAKHL